MEFSCKIKRNFVGVISASPQTLDAVLANSIADTILELQVRFCIGSVVVRLPREICDLHVIRLQQLPGRVIDSRDCQLISNLRL